MRTGTLTAAAIMAALCGTAHGQAASWNNPAGGNWNDAANWSPMTVPNAATFDVTLGMASPYAVLMNINNASVGTLSISNPSATLNIGSGNQLIISAGSLVNQGSIVVNPTAQVFDARLTFVGTATISGSGEIFLGAASETGDHGDARLVADLGATVTIGSDQIVRGNGSVGGEGSFVNQGIIRGDDPLGRGIRIETTINQTGGGTLDVNDGFVILGNGASIIGGEVSGSGDGAMVVSSNPATVTDFIIEGPVQILGGNDRLEVFGDLTNNSTVELNQSLQVFNSTLRFMTDSTVSGSGTFQLTSLGDLADAQIDVVAGATATFEAFQNIVGSGRLTGNAVIHGGITADGPVDFGIEDTITGTGTLGANTDSLLTLRSATVSGLAFDTAPTGLIAAFTGESFVDNIHNLRNLGIAGSSTRLSLMGDIINDGLLTINYTDMVFNAVLNFENTASILGTGDIRMITAGSPGDAQIVTSNASVGTFGDGQTIAGSGQISGDFVNLGVIIGDDPEASMDISGTMSGTGQIMADGGSVRLLGLAIDGHTFSTTAGSMIAFGGANSEISNAINNGNLGIDGDSTLATVTGPLTNNGQILINNNDLVFNAVLEIATDTPIDGTGSVVLETAGSLGDARIEVPEGVTATLGAGQDLSGSGQLIGDLTVLGTLDPSGDLRELNARSGTLTLGSSTRFDLGGLAPAEFDRVTTSDDQTVALGGSIQIALDSGYTPMFGDEWEIIGGANNTVIEGAFDAYLMPAAPPSLAYRVFIEADRVFVRLTCAADFNGDALQNFFDISNYIDLFNNEDPRADLAAPFGALNFFDIATYISIYNAGCN